MSVKEAVRSVECARELYRYYYEADVEGTEMDETTFQLLVNVAKKEVPVIPDNIRTVDKFIDHWNFRSVDVF